jgi:hypothetical protein
LLGEMHVPGMGQEGGIHNQMIKYDL